MAITISTGVDAKHIFLRIIQNSNDATVELPSRTVGRIGSPLASLPAFRAMILSFIILLTLALDTASAVDLNLNYMTRGISIRRKQLNERLKLVR